MQSTDESSIVKCPSIFSSYCPTAREHCLVKVVSSVKPF